MKTLITGANGFVGAALKQKLSAEAEHQVVSVIRRHSSTEAVPSADTLQVADLSTESLPKGSMVDVDAVVHTAARVHIMKDSANDPLAESLRVNRDATLRLARQAATEGVKRFVFISTAKVHGEASEPGRAFTEQDAPAPEDPYAVSKYEAEKGLRELGLRYGMDIVIVRPPLVYGPGVKANFKAMMHWVRRGVPLPLGAVNNSRSLVSLDNLVDLIALCLRHPAAANQVFLAADGEDVSTTELLRLLAQSMDKSARLIPVPVGVLLGAGKLLGKEPVLRRLCGNFQVRPDNARRLLNWQAPLSLQAGLERTVQAFLTENS
ncbi:SDR family oxidoreductase [Marinimicrobium sp. ABcell2]|uniref:UDP-glucose 4-epimerase family protein n=1 Tax=Marinimicrobium sp. ABcell2 TaxID=3069751 RepID=UPI0027B68EFD|nr:SDR family oxidoreductase [Marinimicrobium sp. ABcell2]MDQ2078346.1 SDR family oxidoreductase [Marinimicrobium sp. ABcell2]